MFPRWFGNTRFKDEDNVSNENIKSACLVLGGGGLTGIAWMTGLLFGLENKGFDIKSINRIIGTSAGSCVGAQICSNISLSDLYQRQIDFEQQVAELVPKIKYSKLLLQYLSRLFTKKNSKKYFQRIGNMAMKTATVAPIKRQQVIQKRLPEHDWPTKDLNIVAVDTTNGPLVFNRNSGISLVDAVNSSCAIPGVWPPVQLGKNTYIDGGVRSVTNADYAIGSKLVLIISPIPRASLTQEINTLEKNGSHVSLVTPDVNSKKAMGFIPLNPKKRKHSAIAGKEQGLIEANRILASFSSL